jgi:hypothetical protein
MPYNPASGDSDSGSGDMVNAQLHRQLNPIEYGKQKTKEKPRPGSETPDEGGGTAMVPSTEVETRAQLMNRIKDPDVAETNLMKGTQIALERSAQNTGEKNPVPVKVATNVACISLESTRFAGYLVAALGQNKTIDEDFINLIKRRLFSFLTEVGEKIADENSMNLKIQEVEFQQWAVEYADFLRKSIHKGDEVAMAFFPRPLGSPTRIEPSASSKMAAIYIEDLKEDVPLDFDLYVYMPMNNKYILYTPEGGRFYGNQKIRLQRRGVKHLHIRREDATELKANEAESYLNGKIDEFKAKGGGTKTPPPRAKKAS